MSDRKPPEPQGPPVLLTKLEVFEWVIRDLGGMRSNLELSRILMEAIGKTDTKLESTMKREDRARWEQLKASIVDPDLQLGALEQAIKDIKALALEERLVAARSQAAQQAQHQGRAIFADPSKK